MSVKVIRLELENIKRIKAVQLELSEKGLTLIGGKNNQGKTSVLDAIAYALGGEKFKPTNAKRDGSMLDPHIKVTLSNGIVVERKGKNGTLTVTDPTGAKKGQTLLNSMISTFALDLPKFMMQSNEEKAKTLLKVIGVSAQLAKLDQEETRIYNRRTEIGRIAKEKAGHAEQLPYYEDVPEEPISASDLIKQQQEILARNGLRQQWKQEYDSILDEQMKIDEEVDRLTARIAELSKRKKDLAAKAKAAQKTPAEMKMESTAEIEESINNIETINAKIRANQAKAEAKAEAEKYMHEQKELTDQLDAVRSSRMELFEDSKMPLQGLVVDQGVLKYNGQPWDCMSGSEQLKVATAIVRKLNPECGFVLMDKLEQMDLDTLQSFGEWLESEDLQVIATRVSEGDECTIQIVDGYAETSSADPEPEPEPAPTVKWKVGEF